MKFLNGFCPYKGGGQTTVVPQPPASAGGSSTNSGGRIQQQQQQRFGANNPPPDVLNNPSIAMKSHENNAESNNIGNSGSGVQGRGRTFLNFHDLFVHLRLCQGCIKEAKPIPIFVLVSPTLYTL